MEILEAVTLIEAPKGGKWFARLIEADKQGSSAYYSKASLERSVGKFKAGTHMYANHLSLSERQERPEGDVNNLIGELVEDGVMRPDGIYAKVNIFSDKRQWVEERANAIGLSIRADGKVEESGGRNELVEITEVHSVDVVTRAGAGGKFVSIMESARPTNNSEGKDLSESQKEDEVEFPKELAEALDAQIKAVNALVEKLSAADKAKADAKAKKDAEDAADGGKDDADENADGSKKKKVKESISAGEIAKGLREAKITEKAEARVIAAVEAGADLTEAIKAEKEIAAEVLAEAAKGGFGGYIANEGGQLSEADRAKSMVDRIFG